MLLPSSSYTSLQTNRQTDSFVQTNLRMLLNAQTYTHKKHLHPYANIQRRIDKRYVPRNKIYIVMRKKQICTHTIIFVRKTMYTLGQQLWFSCQSGRFRHQRSIVQIQSLAKFILNIVYCQLNRKDENKEKEAGNGPF